MDNILILFVCFFCTRLLVRDSNNESLPNISNTDVSIFLVSQHNEPINSTFYSHDLQVGTDVFFPQIIFADAEQFAIYQFNLLRTSLNRGEISANKHHHSLSN